jgi:hypothetical protein
MYREMAERRGNLSSFKVLTTKSTDMVMVLMVSCDRKSLHVPTIKSGKFKGEVLKKSVFIYSNVRRTISNTDTCCRLEQL